MTDIATLPAPVRPASLVERVASRYSVEPGKLLATLKSTCFRQKENVEISNEQMMSLLIVAEQYNLNPFTRELFAFDDRRGGIIPYVSVDGWARIVNEHPQFDGMQFAWDEKGGGMTCIIFRKDRAHPTTVTEYLVECRRETDAWKKTPRRMLRHRSMMQCGRLAFGFAGLHDRDEAEAILAASTRAAEPAASTQRAALNRVLRPQQAEVIEAVEVVDPDTPVPDEGEIEFQALLHELYAVDTRDEAAQVLERAAATLGPDELAQLHRACEERFNQGED